MTKTDLLRRIYERTCHTQTEKSVKEVVDIMIEEIESEVKLGNSVHIRGFLSFDLVDIKARKVYNFKKPMDIPATKRTKVTLSDNFKYVPK